MLGDDYEDGNEDDDDDDDDDDNKNITYNDKNNVTSHAQLWAVIRSEKGTLDDRQLDQRKD